MTEDKLRKNGNLWHGSQPWPKGGKCRISESPGNVQCPIRNTAIKPSKENVFCRSSKFKLPPMPQGAYELLDQDNDTLTFLDLLCATVINFMI